MDEFAELLDAVPTGVALLDLGGSIRRANAALARRIGRDDPASLTGTRLADVVHPDDVAAFERGFGGLLRGGPVVVEVRVLAADGGAHRTRLHLASLPAEGDPTAAVASVEDLACDHGPAAGLGDLADRYDELVEWVPAVVYRAGCDPVGRWEYVSPQLTTLLDITPAQWLEQPGAWRDRLHPDDRAAVLAATSDLVRRGRRARLSRQYRLLQADGRTVWVRDDAVLEVDDEGIARLCGIWTDLTREKELEARLEHQSLHDALTGLANRELLMDRVAHRLTGRSDSERSGALLVVDLDDFKAVNDRHGHAFGDALLCAVAERLRESTRPADTVARTGSDEFVVLLEAVDQPLDRVAAGARVHTALQRPYHLEGVRLELAASVGMVDLSDAPDAMTALGLADQALHRAKGQGRGCIVRHEPTTESAAASGGAGRQRDLHAELVVALESDEVRLLLQPVVGLDTGEFRALEAQVGWQHPELGPVDPATVRLLARQQGVSDLLDRWVLERAATWLAEARSRDRAHELPLLLPRSARWLRHPAQPAELATVLGRHGLQPGDVRILVPEGALVSGPVRVGVRHLREQGHAIVIGDFGTGYASLAPLAEGSAETLRLDARLVADLEVEGGQTLPETLVQLAGILGVEVTAAGVDTPQQAQLLRSMGCRFAQGDWLVPPQPTAQVEARLDAPRRPPLGRPHAVRVPR